MKLSVAALALSLASCATPPPSSTTAMIMPGYLDLPLAQDHRLAAGQSTAERATVTLFNDLAEAERAYREALLSMGWVAVNAHKLKKGDGEEARCVVIYAWVIERTFQARMRPHEISFHQESCSSMLD